MLYIRASRLPKQMSHYSFFKKKTQLKLIKTKEIWNIETNDQTIIGWLHMVISY